MVIHCSLDMEAYSTCETTASSNEDHCVCMFFHMHKSAIIVW